MYTMIVVDDEMEIRRGFCTYFPWQEIGFEIRADFKSAQEAEEYLKEHQTDVLVTDIRMRGMSGIELIEAVRNAGVNMEIVVISGYRDFDYAQQVMKMRVRHYLVKPMKYAQIMEVFTEIRQELDAKNGVQNREEVKPIQEKTEATKNETNEVIRRVKNYIYDHMEDDTMELAAESDRMNPPAEKKDEGSCAPAGSQLDAHSGDRCARWIFDGEQLFQKLSSVLRHDAEGISAAPGRKQR